MHCICHDKTFSFLYQSVNFSSISHYMTWYLAYVMDKTLTSTWPPAPWLNVYPELQVEKPRPFFQAILPHMHSERFLVGNGWRWLQTDRRLRFTGVKDPILSGFPGTVADLLALKSSVSVSCKIRFGTPNVPCFFQVTKVRHP